MLKVCFFAILLSYSQIGFSVGLAEVLPIFRAKCATCHRGPFLDFSKYPFFSDLFSTEEKLMHEVALRLEGVQRKIMPPVNGKPLTPEEKQLLLAWIQQER